MNKSSFISLNAIVNRVVSVLFGLDYTLKDSTAFGMPLTKVEVLSGNEWAHLTLFFKDNKFKTLRPKFKLPKIDPVHMKVLENNASGYEIKMPGDKRNRSLIFNAKQKTITCDW